MTTIRKGNIADLEQVCALQHEFINAHLNYDPVRYKLAPDSKEKWLSWANKKINNTDFALFVAEKNLIIGYITGWTEQRPPLYAEQQYGFLSNLYVQPAHSCEGIGKLLVKTLFEWFGKEGITHSELIVDINSSAAVKFWESIGYRPIIQRMRVSLTNNDSFPVYKTQ